MSSQRIADALQPPPGRIGASADAGCGGDGWRGFLLDQRLLPVPVTRVSDTPLGRLQPPGDVPVRNFPTPR